MQIEEYNTEYLNLVEFIKLYDLDMIINNELIKTGTFELENHDKLFNDLYDDVTATPEDYIDLSDIETPEELEDVIYDYCSENLETDIYQYYIINPADVTYFNKYTDYPIYYSEEYDLYLVGITHYGMGWSFFFTTATRPDYMKNKEYDKILAAGK